MISNGIRLLLETALSNFSHKLIQVCLRGPDKLSVSNKIIVLDILIMENCKTQWVFLPGQVINTAAVERNVARGTLQ